MNRIQLIDEIANARKYLAYFENIKPDCTTCASNISGKCKKHDDQPIPGDFLREGCDEWEHDGAPF